MILTIELDQEEDGRWIAEVVDIPGALAYGTTPEQAKAKAKASHCECLLTNLSMAKQRLISQVSLSHSISTS